MNILVVAHYYGSAYPTSIFINDQINAYASLGHNVRVVVPVAALKRDFWGRRFSGLCRTEVVSGVTYSFVRYLSLSSFGEKTGFNTVSAKTSLSGIVKKAMGDFVPDVVHAHMLGFDSGVGAMLANRYGCPLVVTVHGSDVTVPFEQGRYSYLKKAADKADCIAVVSDSLAARLKTCGVETRVATIYNGFRADIVKQATDKKLMILQVGNVLAQKRFDVTMRAFALLKAEYPAMSMTAVGGGPELQNLKELSCQLGIEQDVEFTGILPNDEVLSRMSEAQFFCMPSVREGFGIVYLEAMASGCITIGTKGEGIDGFIKSGQNGFLVSPDNPGEIAEIIKTCLCDDALANRVVDNGKCSALQMTWERNANEYLQLFLEIITSESTKHID